MKPEDIFASLSGDERFTTFDLAHAYNQLLLDDESRQYITINTHKGLYLFVGLSLSSLQLRLIRVQPGFSA